MTVKHKKSLFGLLVFTVAAAVLVFCVNLWERKPQTVFEQNRDTLESVVQQYLEQGIVGYPPMDGVTTVNLWPGENTILEFMTSGSGIAPASRYCGFYYSVNGTPAAFQGIEAKLEQQEDGWLEWHGEGDNGGRTKQIEGNWYVFEAHF